MEDKLKQMKARKKTNDLSDIVLEKDSNKVANTKKWLLTAASAVLLFLIGLVVMKMLNKPEGVVQSNMASVGENIDTLLPNDSQKMSASAEEALFKKEPIIEGTDKNTISATSDTDLKFEEMVRKLKEQDQVNTPTTEEIKNETLTTKVKEVKQPIVEVVQDTKVDNIVTPTPAQKTPVVKAPVIKAPQVVEKEIITQTAPKEKSTPVSTLSGYFIQVGATAKSFPNKKFLQKVKRAGFDYIVHSVTIQGKAIKKVLVGPYNSRDAAASALVSIKANINPSAYVYRIK